MTSATTASEESQGSHVQRPETVVETPAADVGHGQPGKCNAQRRQANARCKKPAGWGTDHVGWGRCRLHGGNTSSHRASASARSTTAEARAMLERLGEPQPIGDPVEALLHHAAKTLAYEDVIRERLAELHEWSALDIALVDREKSMVREYGAALDRSARVLEGLARLGLDERLTRVREIQALRLVDAVGKVLSHPDLALTPELQRQGRAILAAELLGRTSTGPTPVTKSQVIDAESQSVSPTSAGNGVLESAR